MPEIRLEHITKRWNKFYAVDDLDLFIKYFGTSKKIKEE